MNKCSCFVGAERAKGRIDLLVTLYTLPKAPDPSSSSTSYDPTEWLGALFWFVAKMLFLISEISSSLREKVQGGVSK